MQRAKAAIDTGIQFHRILASSGAYSLGTNRTVRLSAYEISMDDRPFATIATGHDLLTFGL